MSFLYNSDSQPGARVSLGVREELERATKITNFTDNFLFGDMRLQKRLRIAELDYDTLKSKNKLY